MQYTGYRGFTLIEMILVIVILAILMSLSSDFFLGNNTNTYYAETCANYLYGSVKNFHYNALVGKSDENITETIHKYRTTFDIENNQITFSYTTGTNSNYKTGNIITIEQADSQRKCSSSTYQVYLTGDSKIVALTTPKNFSHIQGESITLQKDGSSAFTGIITIIQEDSKKNITNDVAQILIDTRNQNITKYTCRIFERSTGTCQERQQ